MNAKVLKSSVTPENLQERKEYQNRIGNSGAADL
jgi:hypothetical protein